MSVREELLGLDPTYRTNPILYRTDCNQTQADKIYETIKDDLFIIRMKQLVWNEFCKMKQKDKENDSRSVAEQISSIIERLRIKEVVESTGIKIYERSKALNMHETAVSPAVVRARYSQDEPIDSIRLARIAWEEGINEELVAIMNETDRPFIIVREPKEISPHLDFESGVPRVPAESVKFLFDSEDLLETGLSIINSNSSEAMLDMYPGLVRLHLRVLSLQEMIRKYSDLSITHTQVGVDDITNASYSKFLAMRHELGESIISNSDMMQARKYLRRGVPPSLRGEMWRLAFGLSSKPLLFEDQTFSQLRAECDRLDLLTDELLLHDAESVADDPRFFVFEDELTQMVFCLSRDEYIRSNSHYELHKPILDLNNNVLPDHVSAPPSGVQPFLGFASYFAPVCYIYKHKGSLYSVCRLIWCELWCKLNVLTSDPETLLSVCKTFEMLLLQIDPNLFLHLVGVGCQPLKIVFPWIQLAFVGILEVDQLLNLWDRVIGYMDPTILALAAVALVLYRSESLMRCRSEDEARTVLAEYTRVQIIPLLQLLLYKDNSKH